MLARPKTPLVGFNEAFVARWRGAGGGAPPVLPTGPARAWIEADTWIETLQSGAPDAVMTAWRVTALDAWLATVEEIRTKGTVPDDLPEGLGAIVNPGNLNAIIEADKIDPLALAAHLPDDMPVLLTCSDTDAQTSCESERPLIDALHHTALTVIELKGVNHVLRDDPADNIANYSTSAPLSPQVTDAIAEFASK